MMLKELELIKDYREHPEKNLPMPDRTGQTPRRNEYGELNIAWTAGLIEENRPYFAEAWAVDGITMLTFYFSSKGIEDRTENELLQLALGTYMFRFRDGSPETAEISKYPDQQGNEFFAVNITVSDGDKPALADVAPMIPGRSSMNSTKSTMDGTVRDKTVRK